MKKLFAIALISTLLFTGCGWKEKEEKEIEEENISVSSDAILDDMIFEQAVSANNVGKCEKILGESKKQECVNTVGSLNLLQEAIVDLDKGKCKKIPIERYKENCLEEIEAELGLGKLEQLFQEEKQNNKEVVQKALDEQDESICNKVVEDEDVKFTCRYNILITKAVKGNDQDICKGIGQEKYEEECLLTLEEINEEEGSMVD
jgi:hypothetical protein